MAMELYAKVLLYD